VVVFQSIFYSEKYANNIFLFFKIIFDISTLKLFENIKNILIQSKKKIKFFQKRFLNAMLHLQAYPNVFFFLNEARFLINQ
jgi:hypothetical protein